MTLRKNQKRIKVPSDSQVTQVWWNYTEHEKNSKPLIQIDIHSFERRKKSYAKSSEPEIFCRINDNYIEIFPPAPKINNLDVVYTIHGML